MKRIYCSLGMLGIVGMLLGACGKKQDPVPQNTNKTDTTSIPADTSLAAMIPFHVGAAVNISLLKNNTAYRNTVVKEYNSLTAENAMKFKSLHPAQNSWTWSDADYLVDFAQGYNKRIHGHTLIWYKSLPSWVETFSGDSTAWENLMKTHIQTVVTHFKGKVASWDVVNEAINDDGSMRSSVWTQHLGYDYIARAFQYAHEADPDALLFYNDFGNEYGSTRRNAIIDLVTGLKNRGIPINGLGMQMHTRYNRENDNIAAAITAAINTGLMVHISELDIAMNPDNNQSLTYTASLAKLQADKYFFIAHQYAAVPKAQRFGITTWNVSDADTWITDNYNRPDWPLPFDNDYKRKDCYYSFIKGAN